VAVSSNIVRTLLEREWIRVVGHRDVPGRPAMFGTTKGFLDYFGLKKLDDLPQLADLSDWESLRVQLNLPAVNEGAEDLDLPENERPVPVLVPYVAGEDLADEDVESAYETSSENDLDDIPELTPLEADSADEAEAAEIEEELVVSEWPDPAESGRG
jgi:segregation and condensation protein B